MDGFVTNWSASAELIWLSLPDECNQQSKSPRPNYGEGLRPLPTFLRYATKIILSRDVAIGGRHYAVGETVGVSDVDTLALINMGKAQPNTKAKARDNRNVGLKTSDAPALVKRGRRK